MDERYPRRRFHGQAGGYRSRVNPYPWLRAVLAGGLGTAAMTSSTALEQRLRPDRSTFVDYDASDHVVTAAAAVLHVSPATGGQRRALFLLTHWGYGSAVAVGYEALRRLVPGRPARTLLFFAGCQTMAFTLFPVFGGTPPPWRWQRAVLVSGLIQHAVYAAVVSAAVEAAAPPDRVSSPDGASPPDGVSPPVGLS